MDVVGAFKSSFFKKKGVTFDLGHSHYFILIQSFGMYTFLLCSSPDK